MHESRARERNDLRFPNFFVRTHAVRHFSFSTKKVYGDKSAPTKELDKVMQIGDLTE